MCLTIRKKDLSPLITEKDLVCYKVLVTYKQLPDSIVSPYQMFRYKVGERYDCESLEQLHQDFFDSERYNLFSGVFHSFVYKKDVKKEISYWMREFVRQAPVNTVQKVFLAECIIPKDSKYYIGVFEDDYLNYGSKSIIIKSIEECVL